MENLRVFSFEKLEVWKKSKELIIEVYALTRHFPPEERFGMTSQIQRAAISIANNIAEGNSRSTQNDKKYFLTIAYGSLMETLNLIIIGAELNYISISDYYRLRKQIQIIGFMLTKLKIATTQKSS
ncbi:MAG TPA: four helix bundle protein [Saprospiraceae bacterium]|nr:four helix bundle protein [Saprospiraceae bacterium]